MATVNLIALSNPVTFGDIPSESKFVYSGRLYLKTDDAKATHLKNNKTDPTIVDSVDECYEVNEATVTIEATY